MLEFLWFGLERSPLSPVFNFSTFCFSVSEYTRDNVNFNRSRFDNDKIWLIRYHDARISVIWSRKISVESCIQLLRLLLFSLWVHPRQCDVISWLSINSIILFLILYIYTKIYKFWFSICNYLQVFGFSFVLFTLMYCNLTRMIFVWLVVRLCYI